MSPTTSTAAHPGDAARPTVRATVGPFSGPEADAWLTGRRNQGATPAEIADELVAHGWPADLAARRALESLRSSDRQSVLWFSLCWAAGLAAVGFTTGVHQLLMTYPDRTLAAGALTLAVVMAPIAAICAVLARRSEQRSSFAVWSPDRRVWFGTLAVCTAVVGIIRLITYVYAVIATMVAATPEPLYGTDLAQVLVSLAVAVPLFWWSASEWRRSNVVLSGLRDHASATTPDADDPRTRR